MPVCLRGPNSPDLPKHIYFHSLISTVVHIANLDFICFLIGGHHLSSPPGTVHARGGADDRYCRTGRKHVDMCDPGQGTKGFFWSMLPTPPCYFSEACASTRLENSKESPELPQSPRLLVQSLCWEKFTLSCALPK